MPYKVYVKKLSSYEIKLKEARRERRTAKRLRASFTLEDITAEQIEEMLITVMARMNSHIRSIVEIDYPELLPLMGANIAETAGRFYKAEMTDTFKQAMHQCDEELNNFVGIVLLSYVIKHKTVLPEVTL